MSSEKAKGWLIMVYALCGTVNAKKWKSTIGRETSVSSGNSRQPYIHVPNWCTLAHSVGHPTGKVIGPKVNMDVNQELSKENSSRLRTVMITKNMET